MYAYRMGVSPQLPHFALLLDNRPEVRLVAVQKAHIIEVISPPL